MALVIDIKVVPSSGQQKIILDKSGIIKVYLKEPPEDGKANRELIKFLAKSLDLRQDEIEIVSGLISRKKRIKISKLLTLDDLLTKIGLVKQGTIF